MNDNDTPTQYAPLRAGLTAADVKIGRGRPNWHDVLDRKTGERIGTIVRLHRSRDWAAFSGPMVRSPYHHGVERKYSTHGVPLASVPGVFARWARQEHTEVLQ